MRTLIPLLQSDPPILWPILRDLISISQHLLNRVLILWLRPIHRWDPRDQWDSIFLKHYRNQWNANHTSLSNPIGYHVINSRSNNSKAKFLPLELPILRQSTTWIQHRLIPTISNVHSHFPRLEYRVLLPSQLHKPLSHLLHLLFPHKLLFILPSSPCDSVLMQASTSPHPHVRDLMYSSIDEVSVSHKHSPAVIYHRLAHMHPDLPLQQLDLGHLVHKAIPSLSMNPMKFPVKCEDLVVPVSLYVHDEVFQPHQLRLWQRKNSLCATQKAAKSDSHEWMSLKGIREPTVIFAHTLATFAIRASLEATT